MDSNPETYYQFVPVATIYSRYNPLKSSISLTKEVPCMDWMVINWNGDVNPCCWDYNGANIMGNVEKQGVFGVWNSEKMLNHRSAMRAERYLDICIDCRSGKVVQEWVVKR